MVSDYADYLNKVKSFFTEFHQNFGTYFTVVQIKIKDDIEIIFNMNLIQKKKHSINNKTAKTVLNSNFEKISIYLYL